jgi:hypothetical protein
MKIEEQCIVVYKCCIYVIITMLDLSFLGNKCEMKIEEVILWCIVVYIMLY